MKNQEERIKKLLAGEMRTLAKAITLVESKQEKHKKEASELISGILSHTGKSKRIGISGTPGVGKSTFIEALGKAYLKENKKIAVLAIDPSSPLSGGSILGDKTRMETLSRNENVFIRPSPTSGSLGGVSNHTRESILLCEAAGYDIIIIETVGVGQSEYDVASMTDFFMLLLQPGSGDELQGIKKGIIELVSGIIINKADGEAINLANQTRAQYESALQIIQSPSSWKPQVLTCSALNNKGIDEVVQLIDSFYNKHSKEIETTRLGQTNSWLKKMLTIEFESKLEQNSELIDSLSLKLSKGLLKPTDALIEIQKQLKLP